LISELSGCIKEVGKLSRTFVIHGLQRGELPPWTLDFDGSVLSTKGHAGEFAFGELFYCN